MMRCLLVLSCVTLTLTGPSAAQDISADNCSVVNTGNQNKTFLVCGDLKLEVKLSPEVFAAQIKVRTQELQDEVSFYRSSLTEALKSGTANAETIAEQTQDLKLAEAALADAEAKQQNLQVAYNTTVIELERLRRELETFRSEGTGIAQSQFDEALAALAENRLDKADELLKEIQALEADRAAIVRQARASYERGKIAEKRIDYRAAKTHFIRAAQLQPENTDYLFKAQSLANKAGDYTLGLRFAQDMLALAKRDGEDTLAYARAANAVAFNLDDQGRYAEAEPLYRKGLEIRERVLGPDHPFTAASYNNLASNLYAQGRYGVAEPLYRKGLEIFERVLGTDHPSTATSYNNVASNLDAQGRYGEAEPLYRKGLEIAERVLGPDHPDTAGSYNNVAVNLMGQDRLAEAEPFLRKAVETIERLLGPEHPTTQTMRANLEVLEQRLGKTE